MYIFLQGHWDVSGCCKAEEAFTCGPKATHRRVEEGARNAPLSSQSPLPSPALSRGVFVAKTRTLAVHGILMAPAAFECSQGTESNKTGKGAASLQTSFKEKEVKNELNPIGGTGRGPIGAGRPTQSRRAGSVSGGLPLSETQRKKPAPPCSPVCHAGPGGRRGRGCSGCFC